jgi:hypothetical protein
MWHPQPEVVLQEDRVGVSYITQYRRTAVNYITHYRGTAVNYRTHYQGTSVNYITHYWLAAHRSDRTANHFLQSTVSPQAHSWHTKLRGWETEAA